MIQLEIAVVILIVIALIVELFVERLESEVYDYDGDLKKGTHCGFIIGQGHLHGGSMAALHFAAHCMLFEENPEEAFATRQALSVCRL